MPTVLCGIAALAVASIYYLWRAYHRDEIRRKRVLRERVAYMLWVMANRNE